MIGTLCSLDLVLFYIFWELMLVPMYLLIGVWGGPRRIYAAIKFFLFTMVGSVLMLLAILALYFHYPGRRGIYTFNVFDLYKANMPVVKQYWLFAAFALSFAIKVPMFPFHTWLPDAHTEAPTAGSVILAGVLLKMGIYGFLRFAIPLFPAAVVAATPLISLLAIIGIIYGAIMSIMQTDLKRLIAFSSREPSGLRDARHVRLQYAGAGGRHLPDAQPRHQHGRPVPHRRDDLRTEAHPDDRRFRRSVQGDAPACRILHDRHPLLDRAAGHERFCG